MAVSRRSQKRKRKPTKELGTDPDFERKRFAGDINAGQKRGLSLF
jgi:hypothetical protein